MKTSLLEKTGMEYAVGPSSFFKSLQPISGEGYTLFAGIKKITPSMAREILETQIRNRTVRREYLERYKSEILLDSFKLNGVPLIFNSRLQLVDGQQRLRALIEADRPAVMLVVSGIKPGAETTIDQGRPRSLGDVFHMNGIRNSHLISRTARWLFVWTEKYPEIVRRGNISKEIMNVPSNHIFEFYEKNKTEIEKACQDFKKQSPIIRGAGGVVLSFVFAVLKRVDLDNACKFTEALISGKTDWEVLKNVRKELIARDRKIKSSEAERISLLFGLWNIIFYNEPQKTLFERSLHIPKS